MNSFLPEEAVLQSVAPLLLRTALAVFFLYFGLRILLKNRLDVEAHFKREHYPLHHIIPWLLGCASTGTAVLLAFGAYTRTTSCIGIYIIASLLYAQREIKIFPYTRRFYVLLLVILTSLLFSGPGLFAFDTL